MFLVGTRDDLNIKNFQKYQHFQLPVFSPKSRVERLTNMLNIFQCFSLRERRINGPIQVSQIGYAMLRSQVDDSRGH